MLVKLLFYTAILLIAVFGYRSYAAESTVLKIGDSAPGFKLNDTKGKSHALSDYSGQYLVLYFYPKNDTPKCTEEACHFRDDMAQLEKLGAKIIGITVDSSESNDFFAKKYHLQFPLLADKDGNVADSYNALTNLVVTKIAKRHTFLINPTGHIEQIYRNVDVSKHSQQIINDLKSLQSKP